MDGTILSLKLIVFVFSLYRQPEPQTPRTSHTASESVLGRRPRNASDAMLEWSPTTKQKLSAFAKVSCDEHGIQSDEKESIVAASQVNDFQRNSHCSLNGRLIYSYQVRNYSLS